MQKGLPIGKPFSLEQGCNPINNPIYHTRHRAVGDHRSCDGKHFDADAGDEPFAAIFHGGRGHRIGKTGDRDQGSRAGVLGKKREEAQPGEKAGEKDQRDRAEGGCHLLFESKSFIKNDQKLPESANSSADQKGKNQVLCHGGFAFPFLDHLGVIVFCGCVQIRNHCFPPFLFCFHFARKSSAYSNDIFKTKVAFKGHMFHVFIRKKRWQEKKQIWKSEFAQRRKYQIVQMDDFLFLAAFDPIVYRQPLGMVL